MKMGLKMKSAVNRKWNEGLGGAARWRLTFQPSELVSSALLENPSCDCMHTENGLILSVCD